MLSLLLKKIRKTTASMLLIMMMNFTPAYAFHSQFILPANDMEAAFLKSYMQTGDVEAALIASGIAPQNYKKYESDFAKWKRDIQNSLPHNASQEQIARQIGYYLHDNVYSSYRLSATTLKDVFETGHFNCLSATIIMMIMLRAFGISTEAIVLPTHVYTSAVLDGKKVEIENTMREGLAISQDPEVQRQFNRLTGFDYRSAGAVKTEISWVESLGLLYSNRSYFDAQRQNHTDAFQNMMKAQVFLHSAPSEQRNLIAGYLNKSYYTYKRSRASLQDYLRTLSILEEGIKRFPNYATLKGNYLKGVDLIMDRMIKADASKEDLDYIVKNSGSYLSANDYNKLQKSYYVRMSLHHMRTNKNFDEAQHYIKGFWEYDSRDKDAHSLIQEYTHTLVKNDLTQARRLNMNPQILRVIGEFPRNLTEESLACYYSGIAKNNYDRGNYDNAVATMKNAKLNIGEHYLVVQNGFAYSVNSAQMMIDKQEFDRAIDFYKEALSFKNDSNVLNNIGILYNQEISKHLNANRQHEAQRLIAESRRIAPNHPALRQIFQQYRQ